MKSLFHNSNKGFEIIVVLSKPDLFSGDNVYQNLLAKISGVNYTKADYKNALLPASLINFAGRLLFLFHHFQLRKKNAGNR